MLQHIVWLCRRSPYSLVHPMAFHLMTSSRCSCTNLLALYPPSPFPKHSPGRGGSACNGMPLPPVLLPPQLRRSDDDGCVDVSIAGGRLGRTGEGRASEAPE